MNVEYPREPKFYPNNSISELIKLIDLGKKTPNQVRKILGLNPIDGGNQRLIPKEGKCR